MQFRDRHFTHFATFHIGDVVQTDPDPTQRQKQGHGTHLPWLVQPTANRLCYFPSSQELTSPQFYCSAIDPSKRFPGFRLQRTRCLSRGSRLPDAVGAFAAGSLVAVWQPRISEASAMPIGKEKRSGPLLQGSDPLC